MHFHLPIKLTALAGLLCTILTPACAFPANSSIPLVKRNLPVCNGASYWCNKGIKHQTLPGTHNSNCRFKGKHVHGMYPNTGLKIKEQLHAGIRHYDLDLCYHMGEIVSCHKGPVDTYLGKPFKAILHNFKKFLKDHPDVFINVQITDLDGTHGLLTYIWSAIESEFCKGTAPKKCPKILKHGTFHKNPTLGKLLADGKQIMFPYFKDHHPEVDNLWFGRSLIESTWDDCTMNQNMLIEHIASAVAKYSDEDRLHTTHWYSSMNTGSTVGTLLSGQWGYHRNLDRATWCNVDHRIDESYDKARKMTNNGRVCRPFAFLVDYPEIFRCGDGDSYVNWVNRVFTRDDLFKDCSTDRDAKWKAWA